MKERQLPVFTVNISNLKVDLRETQLINTMLGLGLFSSTHDVVTELKIAVNWAPVCFSCPRTDQRYD